MSRKADGYNVVENCAKLSADKTFENLYRLICSHASSPAALWLENGTRKYATFTALAEQTDVWSRELSKQFGKAGRVAISLDCCKEWFPLFWGLVRSGHDTLLLDASMNDEKICSLMDNCGCRMIVSGKRRHLSDKYKQIHIAELKELPEKLPEGVSYKPVWGHNIALCTSGTTSDSNTFVYNEDTICDIALFSEKVMKENRLLIDDTNFRTLAFLPFHHILGFAGIFIWSGFLGYTTVYLKDSAPRTIAETAKRCKVTQIVAVPLLANSITKSFYATLRNEFGLVRVLMGTMLNFSIFLQSLMPKTGYKIANHMFRKTQRKILGNNIKSIVLGGSHADPSALKLLNGIGYYTVCGFGMTETAITSFETSWNLQNRLKGSIGEPMANTEYRIKGPGVVGELQIRGAGMHDGRYVNGQFVGPDIDADGWFSSGDIIRINKGAKQYFIEGRIKDVIVNESGENVYPDELEDLFTSLQGAEQMTVLGLSKKASKYEDISLVANVGDKFEDNDFLESMIASIREINKSLPAYKRLSKVFVTSEKLPVANGFKVKRLELKKLFAQGKIKAKELLLNTGTVASEQVGGTVEGDTVVSYVLQAPTQKRKEMIDKVRETFADVLTIPIERITENSHFIDELGGDSLQILSVATKLEEEYTIIIPDEEYVSCATPALAADMLTRLIYGQPQTLKKEERLPVSDFEDTAEYKDFKARREALLATGDDPYFVSHESPLRDTCIINGRELIDFGNYNYAGMSGRKEVNEAAKKAIDKYGTSSSGSRLLAGEKPIHGELERAIAEWKHTEDAVVCVGGHSTNVTFVGNFCGKNDLILYDALAHNSVAQGCKLSDAVTKSFPHNNVEALEKMLSTQRKYFEKVLIVIEGVYSMDGDIADVPAFVALKKKYGCFLMVDEAHSACVLGKTGGGVDEYFGLAGDDIDIKMGTLSKGLGTCGGYLAGKKALVEYLRYNLPGFVFSVGISPALAAASLEAIRLLKEDPSIMENMQRNIKCFAEEAAKRNLNICLGGKSAILPVLVGSDEDAARLSNEMNKRGVAVPPAMYPAVPKGKARLRFDVTSEHKPKQIIYALDALVQAAKDLGITLPSA